ncbi:hypothetical protein [Gallaecimonas sp. GXIMD4217]|uniref:hypothetical protein n=1 Tax=Gallaecimonas sp. GXIMD4217 TaxID=3131927 RepID=UPI00311AE742
MKDRTLLRLLKAVMITGFCLNLLGLYLHNFSDTTEAMGVTGIIISALGMALSLPAKMYLTFVWVRQEQEAGRGAKG